MSSTPAQRRVLRVDIRSLGPGQSKEIRAGGHDILLCNAGGSYYALENRCSHASAPLTGGRIENCILECPLHGGKLDVRDGSPVALPIRKPVCTFEVQMIEGQAEIALGET
ncbi:MAG: non-heme iron oxygenase ferredoxin subunit [Myxococcales bacterium]|nr:MAG: non-heme iron oxygenase ferredoxin subunit [Myxococcales bacterium]